MLGFALSKWIFNSFHYETICENKFVLFRQFASANFLAGVTTCLMMTNLSG